MSGRFICGALGFIAGNAYWAFLTHGKGLVGPEDYYGRQDEEDA